MKKLKLTVMMIAVLAIGMFGLTGCENSKERIAQLEAAITTAQQISTTADQQIILITEAVPALQQSMIDANIPAELRQRAGDALKMAQEKLITFKEEKKKADAAIATMKTTIEAVKARGEVDWTSELSVYSKGAAQVGQFLPPPYNAYLTFGGYLLSIICGLFAAKKTADATKNKTALEEVISGNEDFKDEAKPEAVQIFKDAQAKAQSDETRKMVAVIKAA